MGTTVAGAAGPPPLPSTAGDGAGLVLDGAGPGPPPPAPGGPTGSGTGWLGGMAGPVGDGVTPVAGGVTGMLGDVTVPSGPGVVALDVPGVGGLGVGLVGVAGPIDEFWLPSLTSSGPHPVAKPKSSTAHEAPICGLSRRVVISASIRGGAPPSTARSTRFSEARWYDLGWRLRAVASRVASSRGTRFRSGCAKSHVRAESKQTVRTCCPPRIRCRHRECPSNKSSGGTRPRNAARSGCDNDS